MLLSTDLQAFHHITLLFALCLACVRVSRAVVFCSKELFEATHSREKLATINVELNPARENICCAVTDKEHNWESREFQEALVAEKEALAASTAHVLVGKRIRARPAAEHRMVATAA